MAEPRIISLIASATEIVAAVGFEEQLVGRSHECDYPPSVGRLPACSTSKVDVDASSREIDDQVRAIVSEGLSVYRVDPDLLNRLAPTVILTQTQCEVCAVSLKDVEQAVCELVSSQPRIVSLEPLALGDIWTDIRSVAEALDDPTRGDHLVTQLTARLDTLRARTASRATRPSIACIEWIDPLMHAGNWVPEIVDVAGGTNLFGESGAHSRDLNVADLAAADPDVVAIMPCGFDIARARRELPPLTSRPEWPQLAAVRNGRVFIADGNQYFNRPGPRVVESAEILAELLHPEAVDLRHRGTGWMRVGSRSDAQLSDGAVGAHESRHESVFHDRVARD